MKLLVIGGRQFLGKHIVEAAQKKGHQVTLFNRGKTNPNLHKEVKTIIGDRENDADIAQLKGMNWDAVIDTCGYTPQTVAKSLDLLADQVDHYLFISTVSVYEELLDQEGLTEEADVLTLSEEEVKEVTAGTTGRVNAGYYGPLKFHCEEEVERAMGSRHTIIRPGLIVGPDDPTNRFTYWPARVAEGGKILAPGSKHKTIQFIDVRDLAEWTVAMAEDRTSGTFNASGPGTTLTMERFLKTCRDSLSSDATFVWAPDDYLLSKVEPWMEMPLWIGKDKGFGVDSSQAIANGLKYRPIEETVRDTYEWDRSRGIGERKAGLDRDKEQILMKEVQDMNE